MLKSFGKTIVLFAGLIWAAAACAVGFGNATLHSALGQPLKVEIALTDVAAKDEGGMTASLASPDAFKAAGLDYPYNLASLKFKIVNRDGGVYIEAVSKNPVNDSFVNLLVQLDWPAGRLLREYTFLLDPPGYKSAQPQNEVEPIEPQVATAPPAEPPTVTPLPSETASEASAPEAATSGTEVPMQPSSAPEATETSAPEAASSEAASAPEATSSEEESAPETSASETPTETAPPPPVHRPAERKRIKVVRGDNLTKIARRVQEPDLTLDQMLVALYRANASKFGGRNMNRLRAGTILSMPQPKDYEHLTQRQAARIIHVQAKNWNAYRQRLAAASAPAMLERSPKQESSGKLSTAVEDKTPVVQKSSKEVLKLSTGEKPGDHIAAGGKQARINAARENKIAQNKQAQENQMRIARQEKIIEQEKKAIALQGGVPAPASAPVHGLGLRPTAPASGAKPGLPGHPPVVHKLPPPAPVQQKSMVDSILDTAKGVLNSLPIDPLYLGGGVAGLLLLIIVLSALRRRNSGGPAKKKKVKINPKT